MNIVSRAPKSEHGVHEIEARELLTVEFFLFFCIAVNILGGLGGIFIFKYYCSEKHFTARGGKDNNIVARGLDKCRGIDAVRVSRERKRERERDTEKRQK